MTLAAIKEAIERLAPDEQAELADWLSEREWLAWDGEIERDFAPGGRGNALFAELEQEIRRGETRPLAEGLAERRRRER